MIGLLIDAGCLLAILAVVGSRLEDALRDVDEIELVGFGAKGKRSFHGRTGSFGIEWSCILETEDVVRLRMLLSKLPDGESERCHMPSFGLLLGAPPRQVHVTICFQCNNLYVGPELVAFDASAAQAQALLAFLQSRMPGGATVT